jgi:hypothetical protein
VWYTSNNVQTSKFGTANGSALQILHKSELHEGMMWQATRCEAKPLSGPVPHCGRYTSRWCTAGQQDIFGQNVFAGTALC